MGFRYLQAGLAIAVVAIMAIACLPFAKAAPSGTTTKLTPEELSYAKAVGKGEYGYGIDSTYSYSYGEFEFPTSSGLMAWRPVSSTAMYQYADYLAKEMRSIGLKNVGKDSFPAQGFDYGGATVQIISPVQGDVWLAASNAGLPGTPPCGIAAPLVYVGLGTKYDYQGKDVSGKLVLIDVSEDEMYWLQYPLMEAEIHGAVGAVITWREYYQQLPNSVVTFDSESRFAIPALDISKENAAVLKNLIASGITPEVKIWADVQMHFDGTGLNVVGYLPGTNYGTPADRYIIVADHYDKWWYGASDNGAGVARVLGTAKALVDSHYKSANTIIFVLTSAEEYGWTDTEFDWALGAWWEIFKIHPDWAGKTVGAFCIEGGGFVNATSVNAYGTPETLEFRKAVLPKVDDFFTKTAPWSKYYVKASVETVSFADTIADEFSFCAAGIPIMHFDSTRTTYAGYDYHTFKDTMAGISGESLAMSTISGGIALIELDRSKVAPYSFQDRAADLKSVLNTKLLAADGINAQPILTALSNFGSGGSALWTKILASPNPANAAKANDLVLKAAYRVLFDMTWVGGYVTSMYPDQAYLDDSLFFSKGIAYLNKGDINNALDWLSNVYGMYTGRQVSYQVYQYMLLDRWDNNSRTDLFWATARHNYDQNIYSIYQSLEDKKAAGITDYSTEIAELTVHYQDVVNRLQSSLNSMTATLNQATALIQAAQTAIG